MMMSLWMCLVLLGADAEPARREWTVEGARREALVVVPSRIGDEGAPVLFAFHGHGGSMRNTARSWALHKVWPEAIVVYPQGLPTPGRFDPEGTRAGWQNRESLAGDRDLKFVDAMLESLGKEHKVDAKRVFATGHSNGGGFTYLLWAARPNTFAAFAPSAAGSAAFMLPGGRKTLPPRPVLHIAGEKDTTVPFANQERTIAAVRKNNRCADKGTEWAPGCTLYPSDQGGPVVTFLHSGTHKYADRSPALIVKFFQEQSQRP